MDGLSFEEILVILLFVTAAVIAIRRIRRPWMCNIVDSSSPAEPNRCSHKAVGSARDALGTVYFFCKNHDPRIGWLHARLMARGINIDTGSVLIFKSSFLDES